MWQGGMYGRGSVHDRGACIVGRACVAGGVCMAGGACIVGEGMHGRGACMAGGHAWQGACVAGGMHGTHAPPQQILPDTVNERVVCILLECILVCSDVTVIQCTCIHNSLEAKQ